MKGVLELHRNAMWFADIAFIARHEGDSDRAKDYYLKALEQEREAAQLLVNDLDAEPTRSILYRSAASIAMNCGELEEARRLISIGLKGKPPEEIAEELRGLLEQLPADEIAVSTTAKKNLLKTLWCLIKPPLYGVRYAVILLPPVWLSVSMIWPIPKLGVEINFDLSHMTLIAGSLCVLLVLAITLIRQKHLDSADLGSILLAFLAGSNLPAAVYLVYYAFSPDSPVTPTKLQGYEKYISAAGAAFLFITVVTIWALCKRAYLRGAEPPNMPSDTLDNTLSSSEQSTQMHPNSSAALREKK